MSGQQDITNLEKLVQDVDEGSDRLRVLQRRFEGYEGRDEQGELTWVPGVRHLYEEAVAIEANAIYELYEREGKRPPGEEVRTTRAVQKVKAEQPKLYGEYHALAGSIKTGERWISRKTKAISGLQTLNKTGATLAGAS